MAKARKGVAARKQRSKRGKVSAKPARKKAAKRTPPKKAKSRGRQVRRGALKSKARKKRPSKTATRKAPRRAVKTPVVEDTIIDVIDEPAPGVVRVTEYETVQTITPKPDTGPETEEQ